MKTSVELEPHEITIILKGLAELPYKESAALIRKIVEQTTNTE